MKFSKKALAGLMALTLVGGVGATWALVTQDGKASGNGAVDGALVLNWGENNIGNVNLTTGTQYRNVIVLQPVGSETYLNDTLTVTFTLVLNDFAGLSVGLTDLGDPSLQTGAAEIQQTLKADNLTYTYKYEASTWTESITSKIIYLEFSYDSRVAVTNNGASKATLTATLGYTEVAND